MFNSLNVLHGAVRQVLWGSSHESGKKPHSAKTIKLEATNIYAAFGNKRGLFEKLLEKYEHGLDPSITIIHCRVAASA